MSGDNSLLASSIDVAFPNVPLVGITPAPAADAATYGATLGTPSTTPSDAKPLSSSAVPPSNGDVMQEVEARFDALQLCCYSASGSLNPLSLCNELQLLTEDRMKELAAEAIRSQANIAMHVPSPESVWIVAQPIVDEPHTCLIATYRSPPNRSPVKSIAKTLLTLQSLGRSIVTARNNHSSSSSMHLGGSDAVADGDGSLTWKRIASSVLAKLKEHLVWAWSKKGAIAVAGTAVMLIGLIPIPYRVHCSVACEPSTRRFVAAPFEATLVKTFVSIGQKVSAGEVLATLDGRELRSQLAGLQAEYAQQNQLKLASLRTREHAEAELARLKSEQLENEIRVVEQKLASLEIRSPIDGIIVNGDLEGAEGAPLTVGQTLFEIGLLDEMVAELQVPEEQVADVQLGLPVTITLDSFGGKSFRSSVDSIHPRSELIAEASIFVAEAQMPSIAVDLKPGMHGHATIAAGYRSLGWMYLHRPYYRARQFLGW